MTTEQTTITVEHSGDGTLVHGTTRDDRPVIDALKAAGFKWSRNIDAWYLPRTWGEPTRNQRVRELERALGDRITVERGDLAKSGTADEWVEARAEAGLARAERLDERSDRHAAEANMFFERSDAAVAGIPFGQPILVGHHSERRHRNALDRSWRNLGKGVEASGLAKQDARAAESARFNATHHDNPTLVARRLQRNEAELRRLRRSLHGTGKAIYGTDQPATGEYAERLSAMITDLSSIVERDKRVLTESGRMVYGKDTVSVGDIVTIRNRHYTVDKANKVTVQIKTHGLTLKYPWTEVTGHQPAGQTREN